MTCPYDPDCVKTGRAHSHPYRPKSWMQRQCACGTRRWFVLAQPDGMAEVCCVSCERVSRINTAYETGRHDQRTEFAGAAPA
jgi:hypothetical protein